MKKIIKLLVVLTLLIAATSFGPSAPKHIAYVMSDEALYANGYKNYSNGTWQYAAVYLFAFIQRNPVSLQNDQGFQTEVTTAFDHCMKELNDQVTDLKNCKQQVAALKPKNNNGTSSVTQGLGTAPPTLRPPSKVTFQPRGR